MPSKELIHIGDGEGGYLRGVIVALAAALGVPVAVAVAVLATSARRTKSRAES